MFQSFEPIIDENSEILILGSFPSVKSRESGFYYGNPQNRFWRMLSQIFGEEIEKDIENKISFLKKHKIALYDVVSQSDLKGSSDCSLEKSIYNLSDLSNLLSTHSSIKKSFAMAKLLSIFLQKTVQP